MSREALRDLPSSPPRTRKPADQEKFVFTDWAQEDEKKSLVERVSVLTAAITASLFVLVLVMAVALASR